MHDRHTPPELRPPYNVPMALEESLTHTRGLEPELARSRNRKAVEDSKTYTLGPMPVHDFMGDFLKVPHPCDELDLLSNRHAFSRIPTHARTVEELCTYLLTALNKRTRKKSRCPGFVFERPVLPASPALGLVDMRPHICCYATHNVGAVASAIANNPSSRAEFGYAELFIEVKADPSHDFFVDTPIGADRQNHDFFASSDDTSFNRRRDRAWGQHICYVTEVFARQYRTNFFTVSVSGSRARFLRWDRGGCIVSESFDVRENPEVLSEFLWRFSQTIGEIRGHDQTVIAALPQEEDLFRKSLRKYVGYQIGLNGFQLDHAMREHYQPGCVFVMHVLAHAQVANADNLRRFLVSRPVVSPVYLTGRATRGFWAVDASTHRVVFLKDTWRGPIEIEGETLERLHMKGVRNIPSLVCHGDVPAFIPDVEYEFSRGEMQGTIVDEYCPDPWTSYVAGKEVLVPKHWHYRLVLDTVGYGFNRVSGTKELLHAAYDVFHAMLDAHAHASRLHRDISIGNIVLVREQNSSVRKGYLVDWDASCETDDAGKALDVGRVGTWMFMSNKVLAPQGLIRKHTLQDDMESLLYVVLYCALLYLPHNLSKVLLAQTIKEMFEASKFSDGYFIGGDGKLDNAVSRRYTKSMEFNAPLKEWLDTVMDFCNPQRRWKTPADDIWAHPHMLDKFWGEFLEKHSLETNDQQPHDHPYVTDKYDIPPEAGRGQSSEDICMGKRPLEDDGADDAPLFKRPRRAAPVSAPSREVRRSNRIRGQQERSPAPRVTRSNARGPTKCTGVRSSRSHRKKL